jgi:thiol:disulfide interchange protein DsbG
MAHAPTKADKAWLPLRSRSLESIESPLMLRRSLALTFLVGLPLMACSDAANTAPVAATGSAADIEAYQKAAKAHGFATGPVMASQTIYVFFDPACPHCAQLWMNAKPLVKKLRIVWIPVGWLRPKSIEVGAAILAAPTPAVAMEEHESKMLARTGALAVPENLPEDAKAKVKANTELFLSLRTESVPLTLYRNGKTGAHGRTEGAISADEISNLVGL